MPRENPPSEPSLPPDPLHDDSTGRTITKPEPCPRCGVIAVGAGHLQECRERAE